MAAAGHTPGSIKRRACPGPDKFVDHVQDEVLLTLDSDNFAVVNLFGGG